MADLNNLTVNGTTDPDSVVVDLTNGNPLPHGLTYSGGGTPGANSLTVENGSITNLTYNATGAGTGNVVLRRHDDQFHPIRTGYRDQHC